MNNDQLIRAQHYPETSAGELCRVHDWKLTALLNYHVQLALLSKLVNFNKAEIAGILALRVGRVVTLIVEHFEPNYSTVANRELGHVLSCHKLFKPKHIVWMVLENHQGLLSVKSYNHVSLERLCVLYFELVLDNLQRLERGFFTENVVFYDQEILENESTRAKGIDAFFNSVCLTLKTYYIDIASGLHHKVSFLLVRKLQQQLLVANSGVVANQKLKLVGLEFKCTLAAVNVS
jgi:hypothetical protein